MKVVVALLVLVAGLGGVAEVAAPMLVEARVEQRVEERTDGQSRVDADAGAFPFLPGLLLDGEMDHLSITLTEIGGVEVPLARVTFALEGILLDRDALFRGETEVTDIESGRVTALIDEGGVDPGVDLSPGQVEVLDGVVGLPGMEAALPPVMMPCTPEATSSEDGVALTCTFEHVPEVLVRAPSQ